MLTDEMLQDGAVEAEHFLLATLLESNGNPHTFSHKFEKKMNRLFRKISHPIQYNLLRTAVAIIIAITTLFGAIFTLSPEVRANVIRWVRSTFEEFFEYSNNGANESTEYEYYLEVLSDGYRELNVIDRKDGKTYLYVNGSGDILQFTYAYGARTDSVFVQTETYTQSSGLVNGITADIYLTSQKNETNVIIWYDPDTDTLFCINTKADQSSLIALAAGVIKRERLKT